MLIDRVTSKTVQPDEVASIQSGRYALIGKEFDDNYEQSLILEPNIPAKVEGKFSSEVGFAQLSDELFTNDDISRAEQQLKVIYDAIYQINAKFDASDLEMFSHFLPPEVSKNITPNELDIGIEDAFNNGVLFQINSSPRMSMRYDTELLPTSRVKRYANNYQAHLVAHSECWQQRTIVGIVPKKLMAKVSEDEAAIYENIVYVRLVDNLFNYLTMYQLRLEEIVTFIGRFGTLDSSNKDHRYITQLTQDWGRAYEDSDETMEQLQAQTESTLESVKSSIRKLSQLRSDKLYQSIPRVAKVPMELKQTNILVHDKNYRRAAKLWRMWLKNANTNRLSPQKLLEHKQRNFIQYQSYVDQTLRQVFVNLGWSLTKDPKGHKLSHENTFGLTLEHSKKGEWRLVRKGNLIARIVVLSEPLVEDIAENELSPEEFLICPENNTLSENGSIIVISPINLHGKEILAGKLQQQIFKVIIREYLTDFKVKLPTAIDELYQGKFDYRLSEKELGIARKYANTELYDAIVTKSHISKYLKQCPVCSQHAHESNIQQTSKDYFKASCRNKECKATWTLDIKESMFVLNDGNLSNGRFSFRIPLEHDLVERRIMKPSLNQANCFA
ncbi:TPA: hypothetical protein ACGUVV_001236 [Vibrio vulnificus]|uniref:hypothetical protein n=1 Tax=Vibrio vulnificus TaxID=672 RepID=UPI000CD311F9|nr:hypothetical protein [Vibrio vulnificus]MCU8155507.1 hypothetical protein [Vibrio vulnificus]POB15804.1 hypothetical protein CRN36_22685 [Vibrio vulnificus]HAS6018946.1 hypothetical protein [Vibrio vulnificus]HAS6352840.1 hypothetical protein [Vibrio vulnificus]HAS6366484.1 hypothetical protein [Vibrio vulnificus]